MRELPIKILIDNQSFNDLESEHGLSLFVETEDALLLCDMGASGAFLRNAQQMGIDLSRVDYAFISHGHSDHTGGLRDFLERYPDKKIITSKNIFEEFYFSGRRGYMRAMSTDHSLLNKYKDNFLLIDNQCFSDNCEGRWISSQIAIVANKYTTSPTPYGNIYLMKEPSSEVVSYLDADPLHLIPDDFKHEQSLIFLTDKGLVIVSSCSHCGVINIIKSAVDFTGEKRVYAFVGGLHLIDSPQLDQEVELLVSELNNLFPNIRIITGHCTSDSAKELLSQKLSGVEFFSAGSTIVL